MGYVLIVLIVYIDYRFYDTLLILYCIITWLTLNEKADFIVQLYNYVYVG